ncbi:MAG: DUF3500 domain-containing protein [Actinomycetota bacterium]|nr:DUF3500 domain-containing protein [Actinomycetota bacterium]MDQ3679953.1 DUF3500 domain-containing protein [Actinomycetota bacterium]
MSGSGSGDVGAQLAPRLAAAAQSFLDTLEAEQRSLAQLPFDAPERRRWHYTPRPSRAGVAMGHIGRTQAKAAQRLVATGLRLASYARLATIMVLEDVLDELEGGRADRHAGDYWMVVFGDPGHDPWGWRFEGHHVSVNHTVADGRVSATPLFLGANPARVSEGGATLLRPLGREEDLALDLLASLDERQRARAVFSDQPPPDIVTGEEPHPPGRLEPTGVAGADLSGQSADVLRALAATFVERLPDDLTRPRLAALEGPSVGELHFAWAGEVAPHRPHYYRIQGPGFFAELDDTEEGGNHVHTVLRDPDDDFGADVLRAHRHAHHAVA